MNGLAFSSVAFSSTLLTPGSFTSTTSDMAGMTTMKMISSTSTTSTSGVTFMTGRGRGGRSCLSEARPSGNCARRGRRPG
jgi:hypothetical protein